MGVVAARRIAPRRSRGECLLVLTLTLPSDEPELVRHGQKVLTWPQSDGSVLLIPMLGEAS